MPTKQAFGGTRWFSHTDTKKIIELHNSGLNKKEIAAVMRLSYDAFRKRCIKDNFNFPNQRIRRYSQKRLTADQLVEVIRLRVEENLWNTEIAARLKMRSNTFRLILERDNITLPHMKFKKNGFQSWQKRTTQHDGQSINT